MTPAANEGFPLPLGEKTVLRRLNCKKPSRDQSATCHLASMRTTSPDHPTADPPTSEDKGAVAARHRISAHEIAENAPAP